MLPFADRPHKEPNVDLAQSGRMSSTLCTA
jgi:hypothetical protein